MKHTPTPWKFSKHEEYGLTRFYISQQEGAPYTHNYSDVATVIAETCRGEYVRIQEENANLIVRAVNAHDILLEYFHACESLKLTMGHESATVDDERKAEERFYAAQKAVQDSLETDNK